MEEQEERFCWFYHWMRNGREAAMAAGYPLDQCAGAAMNLLQKRSVQKKLNVLDKQWGTDQIRSSVIAGLMRIAFGSINDCAKLLFQKEEGDINQLDLFSVSEMKRNKDNSVELRFCSRMEALEKLLELTREQSGENSLQRVYEALAGGNEKTAEDIRRKDNGEV